ncbi:uncharacterized protein LOC127857657 isoform X2 [Dreissena polymorpha]|nr:uncharacterized protein LOC127857657 isoform X2 [Dreissena polymorpha]
MKSTYALQYILLKVNQVIRLNKGTDDVYEQDTSHILINVTNSSRKMQYQHIRFTCLPLINGTVRLEVMLWTLGGDAIWGTDFLRAAVGKYSRSYSKTENFKNGYYPNVTANTISWIDSCICSTKYTIIVTNGENSSTLVVNIWLKRGQMFPPKVTVQVVNNDSVFVKELTYHPTKDKTSLQVQFEDLPNDHYSGRLVPDCGQPLTPVTSCGLRKADAVRSENSKIIYTPDPQPDTQGTHTKGDKTDGIQILRVSLISLAIGVAAILEVAAIIKIAKAFTRQSASCRRLAYKRLSTKNHASNSKNAPRRSKVAILFSNDSPRLLGRITSLESHLTCRGIQAERIDQEPSKELMINWIDFGESIVDMYSCIVMVISPQFEKLCCKPECITPSFRKDSDDNSSKTVDVSTVNMADTCVLKEKENNHTWHNLPLVVINSLKTRSAWAATRKTCPRVIPVHLLGSGETAVTTQLPKKHPSLLLEGPVNLQFDDNNTVKIDASLRHLQRLLML